MAPTLKPEPGDLIEIFRGIFQHWAVCVDDGFVVHLTSPYDVAGASANHMMSVPAKKAKVKKEKLTDVVGTSKWKVNNILDKEYDSCSARTIVEKACAMVGSKRVYNVLKSNCEHFANELRYGKAESRQVRKAGLRAKVVGVATTWVLTIVGVFGAVAGALVGLFRVIR